VCPFELPLALRLKGILVAAVSFSGGTRFCGGTMAVDGLGTWSCVCSAGLLGVEDGL